MFSEKIQRVRSVMDWGLIPSNAATALVGIDGNMDSVYYCHVL